MRSTKSHILDRTRTKYAGIFACVFAFVLSVVLCPGVAQAEVRNSDVVLGQTIEEQGLPLLKHRISLLNTPISFPAMARSILRATRMIKSTSHPSRRS